LLSAEQDRIKQNKKLQEIGFINRLFEECSCIVIADDHSNLRHRDVVSKNVSATEIHKDS
jgi:hypothetical protein